MQPRELVVVHECEPKFSDVNLIKLAGFAGVPVRGVPLGPTADSQGSEVLHVIHQSGCVAMSASTLRKCLSQSSLLGMLQRMKVESPTKLLVYGFRQSATDSELVRDLSRGAFGSVSQPEAGASRYGVSKTSRSFCQEFCGLTFGSADRGNDSVFQRRTSDGRTVDLISAGRDTFLAAVQNGASFIVLSGARQILDVDATVAPGVRPLEWFSRLAPTLMFLRYAFGDRCWQPGKKLACFILDDPLLQPRYGYLRYDSLLEVMERSNFATNLAFVPWNYNRSRRITADLFLRHPNRFSLSIHGCDHTKWEFGGVDEVLLSRKAAIAQKRMERHRELTGTPFDNVMIFPQGIFSSTALKALKITGYLAVVNSTPFPVDGSCDPLRVRDLLAPAITRYWSFPLFVRRYPNCIAEFALDLFLGKPALMVEHHDYFRDGYGSVQTFTEQINRLSDGITWCSLGEVVRATCFKRQRDDGTSEVQFYHNRASVVEDRTGHKKSVPRENLPARTDFPSMNGDSDLQLGSAPYRIGVSARRYLCEFRDNYLSRSRGIVGGLNMLKSKLAK